MTNIEFTIKDQAILAFHTPILASGGKNDIKVTFNFTYSEEWKGYAKTGVFYMDKNDIRFAKLDSQNSCFVPWETYRKDGILHIGVFGVKGDSKKTSALYEYTIREGAISDNGKPSDPTPEIYEQILSEFAKMETDFNNKINSVETRVDNLINAQPVDAELKDVRVGYNDIQYPNAGTAVREQARKLSERISELKRKVSDINGLFPFLVRNITPKDSVKGVYLDNKGVEQIDSRFISLGFVEIDFAKGFVISTEMFISNEVAGVCFYDHNKEFIKAFDSLTAEQAHIIVHGVEENHTYNIPVPANATYFRVCRFYESELSKTVYYTVYFPDFALGNNLKIIDDIGTHYYNGSKEMSIDLTKIRGISDYTELTNKPSINGKVLFGNQTADQLGLQPKGNYATTEELTAELEKKQHVGNYVKNEDFEILKKSNDSKVDKKLIDSKTENMTVAVGIDSAGKLFSSSEFLIVHGSIDLEKKEIGVPDCDVFTMMEALADGRQLIYDAVFYMNGGPTDTHYYFSASCQADHFGVANVIFTGTIPSNGVPVAIKSDTFVRFVVSYAEDFQKDFVRDVKFLEIQNVKVDKTLSVEGMAADAKAVGDKIKHSDNIYIGKDPAPILTKIQIDPNGKALVIPDVLQTIGDSETDTMSQKAITEAIAAGGGGGGNINYATFEINPATGILEMNTSAAYTGANFAINNNGELEVIL